LQLASTRCLDAPLDSATSILDVLRWRALHHGRRRAFLFVDQDQSESEVTYEELDRRALAVAALLEGHTQPGATALLLYPQGLEFIAAFLGCLYGRVIAVPAQVPQSARYAERFLRIASDCGARLALTDRRTLASAGVSEPLLSGLNGARLIATDEAPAAGHDSGRPAAPDIDPESVAFLQYTSGATGPPRGVMITHRNMVENQRAITQASQPTPDTLYVSWLPMFHDMGLIGGVMHPLFIGAPGVLMAPGDFVRRPRRWVEYASRFRATNLVAPNFAYDLCAAAARQEHATRAHATPLDLSSLRAVWNGAEPIRAATLRRFDEAYGPNGFAHAAHFPCYGMAETTLLATVGQQGVPPRIVRVGAAALERGQAVEARADERAYELVSSGRVALGMRIEVVDAVSRVALPERAVGEIWISGTSVGKGYWSDPPQSRGPLDARLVGTQERFFRSGDLGFLWGGELFVLGRAADAIRSGARTLAAEQIEEAVERALGLRANCVAALPDAARSVRIVIEADRALLRAIRPDSAARKNGRPHASPAHTELATRVRASLRAACDIEVGRLLVVKPGGLPRTTSGKLRRFALREALSGGVAETVLDLA